MCAKKEKTNSIFKYPVDSYKKVNNVIITDTIPEIEKYQRQKPNWYVRPQKDSRQIYKHQYDLRKKLLRKDLKKIIAHLKKRKLVFLDIGCGDGHGLEDIKPFKRKLEIYGCDYNLLRLSRAKKLAPYATLFLADANKELIKDASCDIILLNHVLEHVHDDLGLLKKIYAYLANGGYLLLGIPQEGTPGVWIRDHILEPYILFKTDHVHFYTDKEIIKKLKKVGFRITGLKYLDYAFPHSIIDRYLRSSKKTHDFMESFGHKYIKRVGAGALWIVVQKPAESRGGKQVLKG